APHPVAEACRLRSHPDVRRPGGRGRIAGRGKPERCGEPANGRRLTQAKPRSVPLSPVRVARPTWRTVGSYPKKRGARRPPPVTGATWLRPGRPLVEHLPRGPLGVAARLVERA